LRSRFIKLTLSHLPFPAIKFLPREESEEDAFGGAGSKSMLKTVDDQGPSARKKPFAAAGGQEPIHWQQFEQEKVEAIPASVKKVSGPTKTIPEHRIVHFDLKGAAPKPDYLKSVMTLAKKSGATGVRVGRHASVLGPVGELVSADSLHRTRGNCRKSTSTPYLKILFRFFVQCLSMLCSLVSCIPG
jgi:hypothetical protein